MKSKILVTGGNGRFAKTLKRKNKKLDLIFKSKNDLNILKIDSLEKKLNSIDMLLNSKSINEKIYEPMSQKFDESVSVFHQLDNQSSTQSNNSLLVLENENLFLKYLLERQVVVHP